MYGARRGTCGVDSKNDAGRTPLLRNQRYLDQSTPTGPPAGISPSKLSSCGECFFLGYAPRGVFVVAGAVAQAAVQDADQPVSKGAQGLMVRGSAFPAGGVILLRPGEAFRAVKA